VSLSWQHNSSSNRAARVCQRVQHTAGGFVKQGCGTAAAVAGLFQHSHPLLDQFLAQLKLQHLLLLLLLLASEGQLPG
jgi:hypothetical protein